MNHLELPALHFVVHSLSCDQLCETMDCSMPGFPVLHHLLELAQTHLHQVGDVIHPSHPLLSPSSPAFNLSHHQCLHYHFLVIPFLFLHSFPSVISNYLNLHLGTQEGSWRLKSVPCESGRGTQKGFLAQEPYKVLLHFNTFP